MQGEDHRGRGGQDLEEVFLGLKSDNILGLDDSCGFRYHWSLLSYQLVNGLDARAPLNHFYEIGGFEILLLKLDLCFHACLPSSKVTVALL